jgi:hypothetical protein
MIITEASNISTSDPESYAWANLRKFQSVELVLQIIDSLRSLDGHYKANVHTLWKYDILQLAVILSWRKP